MLCICTIGPYVRMIFRLLCDIRRRPDQFRRWSNWC